jgi:hypothetical protein
MRRATICMLAIAGLVLLAGSAAAQDARQVETGVVPSPLGACPTDVCPATPPTLITGTLGSCGDWPQCISGTQTGRLNRNGIGSTCITPKACAIFDTTPGRAFDAYTITNGSGATACVNVTLTVITQTGCNLQLNGYLNTYDPANICEPQSDYLADAGFSSGTPPATTSWCGNVPAGDDLILVVHTINPGEIGCQYEIAMTGDCIPVELMDFTVEDM